MIPAAGAVLWRRRGEGVEVALVHRPKYDDWSLPKGKLDAGETLPETAVREVGEETGFHAVLGRRLRTVRYSVSGAEKFVEYWAAEARAGEFTPNHEVDELRWVPVPDAPALLTHAEDALTLRVFSALPPALPTLVLVRHAKAGKRDEWAGDDDLRPLAPAGFEQAAGVRRLLPLFGVDRIVSAPRLRCVQTVRGAAEDLGIPVEQEPLVAEEGYWDDPPRGLACVLSIAAAGGRPAIASQGGVIPDVVAELAARAGLAVPEGKNGVPPSKKGSLWVLSFLPASAGAPEAAPSLAAADYYPSALPYPEPVRP